MSVATVLFLDRPLWNLWIFLGYGIVALSIVIYLVSRLAIWASKKNSRMRFHGIRCQCEEVENNDNFK